MIKITAQPQRYAHATTPIKYEVSSDNVLEHYTDDYKFIAKLSSWTVGQKLNLKIYFQVGFLPFQITPPEIDGESAAEQAFIIRDLLLDNEILNSLVHIRVFQIAINEFWLELKAKDPSVKRIEGAAAFLSNHETFGAISHARKNYRITATLYAENIESRNPHSDRSDYDIIHTAHAQLSENSSVEFDFTTTAQSLIDKMMLDHDQIIHQLSETGSGEFAYLGYIMLGVYFFESWTDEAGETIVGDTIYSIKTTVLPGGVNGSDRAGGLNFFNDSSNHLLSSKPLDRIIHKDSFDILTFWIGERTGLSLRVMTSTTSGTSYQGQIALDAVPFVSILFRPNSNIKSRSYTLEEPSGNLDNAPSITYYVDHNHREHTHTFVYLSALGVPEVLAFHGSTTEGADINKELLHLPIHHKNKGVGNIQADTNYKLSSGYHYQRDMFYLINELLASRFAYKKVRDQYLPVVFNNKKGAEQKDFSNLNTLVLEYTYALASELSTTKMIEQSVQRSVCKLTYYYDVGAYQASITLEASDSDGENLEPQDMDVEFEFTLQRPQPVTVLLRGKFSNSLNAGHWEQLSKVGLSMYQTSGDFNSFNLVKNSTANPDLAYPILVKARVRASTYGDQWSAYSETVIDVQETASQYGGANQIKYHEGYLYMIGSVGRSIIRIDEQGRSKTIIKNLPTEVEIESFDVDNINTPIGYPDIYTYSNFGHLYRHTAIIVDGEKEYTYSSVFEIPNHGVLGKVYISLHPTLRTGGNYPLLFLTGGSQSPRWSTIEVVDITAGTMTRIINTTESSGIADGDGTETKIYRASAINMVSDTELLILEYGTAGKTSTVRKCNIVLTGSDTNKIAQIKLATNWQVRTILGGASTVNSSSDMQSAVSSGDIIIGASAATTRLHNASGSGIVKVGGDIYLTSFGGKAILKLSQKPDTTGNKSADYIVTKHVGQVYSDDIHVGIPSLTSIKTQQYLAASEKYIYFYPYNFAIAKANIADQTIEVFSGRQGGSLFVDYSIR